MFTLIVFRHTVVISPIKCIILNKGPSKGEMCINARGAPLCIEKDLLKSGIFDELNRHNYGL